jgi:hypothetical protein
MAELDYLLTYQKHGSTHLRKKSGLENDARLIPRNTYVHAGDIGTELAVVVKSRCSDLSQNDTKNVDEAGVDGESVVVDIVDQKGENDWINE